MPGVSQLDNMLRWGAMLSSRPAHAQLGNAMPMLVSIAPVPCVSEACAPFTGMKS